MSREISHLDSEASTSYQANQEDNALWACGHIGDTFVPLARRRRSGFTQVDEMDKWLESRGFYRKHIARDGTSLFRCVSEEVFLSQNYHETVREHCAEYAVLHKEEFSKISDMNVNEYAAKIRNIREPGGLIEMQIISTLYKYDFLVYTEVGKPAINVTSQGHERVITLSRSNETHYDSVFTMQHIESSAFCQSMLYEMLYEKVFKLEGVNFVANKMLHEQSDRFPKELNAFFFNNAGPEFRRELRDSYKNVKEIWESGITPFPYKVAKALDPTIYRNVAYDAWNVDRKNAKRRSLQWDNNKLQVGSKCRINFKEGDSVRSYHGYVQEMTPNNGPVFVFIQELGKKLNVPYDNLELIPFHSTNEINNRRATICMVPESYLKSVCATQLRQDGPTTGQAQEEDGNAMADSSSLPTRRYSTPVLKNNKECYPSNYQALMGPNTYNGDTTVPAQTISQTPQNSDVDIRRPRNEFAVRHERPLTWPAPEPRSPISPLMVVPRPFLPTHVAPPTINSAPPPNAVHLQQQYFTYDNIIQCGTQVTPFVETLQKIPEAGQYYGVPYNYAHANCRMPDNAIQMRTISLIDSNTTVQRISAVPAAQSAIKFASINEYVQPPYVPSSAQSHAQVPFYNGDALDMVNMGLTNGMERKMSFDPPNGNMGVQVQPYPYAAPSTNMPYSHSPPVTYEFFCQTCNCEASRCPVYSPITDCIATTSSSCPIAMFIPNAQYTPSNPGVFSSQYPATIAQYPEGIAVSPAQTMRVHPQAIRVSSPYAPPLPSQPVTMFSAPFDGSYNVNSSDWTTTDEGASNWRP